MTSLIILGAGGLGLEAKWALDARGGKSFDAEALSLAAFVDDDAQGEQELDGISVSVGIPRACAAFDPATTVFHCAIGDNASRARVASMFTARGFRPVTLAHPSAVVAPSVVIEGGCYLGAFVIVGPKAHVKSHVILNSHAAVGHHAQLDSFSQVCPGAKVSGNCVIGLRGLVGSNATMLPGARLGADSVLGSNSLLLRSTRAGESVLGVPARPAPGGVGPAPRR